VDGGGGKGGEADGDVFGAFGRGVLNPFAGMGDDALARGDVERAAFVRDAQHALQDYGEFFEFGCLARLDPSGGALHARDAQRLHLRVYAADKLFDDFRLVAGGFDSSRPRNECWHRDLPR